MITVLSVTASVEGISDRGAVLGVGLQLRRKIRIDLMSGNDAGRLAGLIEQDISDIYIICKDYHTYTDEDINRIFNRTKNKLHSEDQNRTYLIKIPYAIESWFLADIDAINEVYNVNLNETISSPEQIRYPDRRLDELLQKCNKRYIKTEEKAKEIMHKADLRIISDKCESFEKFLELLEASNNYSS